MTVGITFSSFDLFHSGHVAMLKEARANCDYMIVGLQKRKTRSMLMVQVKVLF